MTSPITRSISTGRNGRLPEDGHSPLTACPMPRQRKPIPSRGSTAILRPPGPGSPGAMAKNCTSFNALVSSHLIFDLPLRRMAPHPRARVDSGKLRRLDGTSGHLPGGAGADCGPTGASGGTRRLRTPSRVVLPHRFPLVEDQALVEAEGQGLGVAGAAGGGRRRG